MPTTWPMGTAIAIVIRKYSMSNQQPTGSSWNFPAGKTPYRGAPSHAQAGGYANIAPGATYNSQGTGTTASATFRPAPAPQRGPTIAQPGPSYAPAHPGAAYAPATSGAAYAPAPSGTTYAPAHPGAAYAPATSGAAYAPAPSGTTYAPAPPGAAYAPAPAGASYASAPAGATYAPAPPGAAYAPAPAGASYASAPAGATYAPAPPGAAYAPAPPGAAYPPAPSGAAYAPSPSGATYAPAPPGASYAPAPSGVAYAPAPSSATYAPAPPGAAYAPAPPGASYAPATSGATYAPAPPGAAYAPAPPGATYAPAPSRTTYTPPPPGPAYQLGTTTAASGYTYQPPPPQYSQPPLAFPPAQPPTTTWQSPPRPPSQATRPVQRREMIDLSDVPPPPPPRPAYQAHAPIMDDTGLFSKDTQRIVDRFVEEIGGRDLSRRFKGVANHEAITSLDMTNDPVIFAEQFRTGFASPPQWALPADQPGIGDQPSMPVKDERTPVRVAVLLKLLPPNCLTKKAHERNTVVNVPTIDISQIRRHAADLTATDLVRVFVQEMTESGQSKLTAREVRKQLHLLPGESWMSAAHRTLLHTRVASVQSYKPHAMEDTYYWRSITGDQLQDHCERVIGVLNPSDSNPFHPVLYSLRSAIRKNLNSRALNEGQLLTRQMVDRGTATQAIYGDFLQELSQLSRMYSFPLIRASQTDGPSRTPIGNPRQRFSAVAPDRRPRHPISPMRDVLGTRHAGATSTATAAQSHLPSRNKHKRSLDKISAILSSLQSAASDDDSPTPPPGSPSDTNEPGGVPYEDDLQNTDDDLSAYANKPASQPGKFGTPFIDGSPRPRSRPRLSGKPTTASGRQTNRIRRFTPTANVPASTATSPAESSPAAPAPIKTEDPKPGQDRLPSQDTHSNVIRRALMKREVCFYHAYGISCPHDPCKYLHETSGIPYAWYRRSVSYHASIATMDAFFHTEEAYGPQEPRESE